MNHHLLTAAAALGLLFAAGCRHKCCRKESCCPPATARPFLPSAPGGAGNTILLPPAGVPTTPAPGGGSLVPSVGPGGTSNFPPPDLGLGAPVKPMKPAPEVLLPDPPPGGGSSRSAYPNDPVAGVVGPPARPQTAEPPVSAGKPAAPAGLSGFVKVKDGVASGRKPALEGFDALKAAGYRTVVYLHGAGADVSAAKDVAGKRGLGFAAIEVTPENLATALDLFNATVADKAARPVYVCDDDGLRAGVLWYLHFRTVDSMNDDAARVRARPLGLTDDGDEAKAFALAVQRYLETR